MHSDLLSPLGVAFTEQIFAVLHDPRHDSIRIAIATVAAAIVDKFKETIATSCYGLWLDFAVHGLGDFCPDVRSRAISLFRSLVPLAPLAMKAPNPNKQGSEGRVSQLLHCLASKSGLPSLLQSSDGRDKFIVGAASIECATPLRPYQWGGVSWWTLLRRCGLSGMLADEM